MKQFKVFMIGKDVPQSQGWRTVHAENEKEAKKKAEIVYPRCFCKKVKKC